MEGRVYIDMSKEDPGCAKPSTGRIGTDWSVRQAPADDRIDGGPDSTREQGTDGTDEGGRDETKVAGGNPLRDPYGGALAKILKGAGDRGMLTLDDPVKSIGKIAAVRGSGTVLAREARDRILELHCQRQANERANQGSGETARLATGGDDGTPPTVSGTGSEISQLQTPGRLLVEEGRSEPRATAGGSPSAEPDSERYKDICMRDPKFIRRLQGRIARRKRTAESGLAGTPGMVMQASLGHLNGQAPMGRAKRRQADVLSPRPEFVDEKHVFERLDATNAELRQIIENRWREDGVDLKRDVVRVGTLGWNEDILNELIDPSVHDRTLPCVPRRQRHTWTRWDSSLFT